MPDARIRAARRFQYAVPAMDPPTNWLKLVTRPPVVVAGDDEADAGLADVAAALVAGALLLVLELELQAATPAIRQVAKATVRHREPALFAPFHGRIPVERTIAPSRLSAVASCRSALFQPA